MDLWPTGSVILKDLFFFFDEASILGDSPDRQELIYQICSGALQREVNTAMGLPIN